jgi:hypothetical protein
MINTLRSNLGNGYENRDGAAAGRRRRAGKKP